MADRAPAPARASEPQSLAFTIRDAEPREHDALGSLAAVAFARFGDYAAPIQRWLATPGTLAQVATREERVLGFVLVALFTRRAAGLRGEVLAIAVDPAARGAGIGAALLEAGVRALRGAGHPLGSIEADVAMDNEVALALFASAGFVPAGLGMSYDHGQRAVRLAL